MVEIVFIVSQDACANSVLSVFYFNLKRVDVCYKWWFVFFATRVGRSYLQLKKLQLEKIKSKKKRAMYNSKSKN